MLSWRAAPSATSSPLKMNNHNLQDCLSGGRSRAGRRTGRRRAAMCGNQPVSQIILRLSERLESFDVLARDRVDRDGTRRGAQLRNRRWRKAFGFPHSTPKSRRRPQRRLESFEFSLESASSTCRGGRRPDAYAIDATTRSTPSPMRKETTSRSPRRPGRTCSSRGRRSGPLAAATNATSAENATAVIEESGLGAKVKKLMPFGGAPKSNRDDALNALADATKEQQVAELDYLGVVASHLPDDVARRRLGQLASEGKRRHARRKLE